MAKIIGEGITFDDVLLVPSYSEVIPNEVDISTNLTHSIHLNIPLMSAGMVLFANRTVPFAFYLQSATKPPRAGSVRLPSSTSY